jgi:hypothetical protein
MLDKPNIPLSLSSTHQQSFYQSTTAFSSHQQQQHSPVGVKPSSFPTISRPMKIKTDFQIAFKELNSFLQFYNHDLCYEYILYNLNTKSIFFVLFFLVLVTFILLPAKILFLTSSFYALTNIKQTYTISSHEIRTVLVIHFLLLCCLLIMSFTTMKYIYKRYLLSLRNMKRWNCSYFSKYKYWFAEGMLWFCSHCCCGFLSTSSDDLNEGYHGSSYSQRLIRRLKFKLFHFEQYVQKQRLKYANNDEEEGGGGIDGDSDEDDDENAVNSDEDDGSSAVNRSAKSISFSSHTYYQREEKHSEQKKQKLQEKALLSKDFLFYQQIFIFSLICYNILIVINTFLRFNCIHYSDETPFNTFFHNCENDETADHHRPDERPMFSRYYIYALVFIPLVISNLFRESLFEVQLFHHVSVLCLTITLAVYYGFHYHEILMFIIWLIGGFLLLIDLHIHNVATFLTSYRLRQLLSDHEKAVDNIHALEMRHMIGNVAHDLKTVRSFFVCLISFAYFLTSFLSFSFCCASRSFFLPSSLS